MGGLRPRNCHGFHEQTRRRNESGIHYLRRALELRGRVPRLSPEEIR
jgi:hypothetical protein